MDDDDLRPFHERLKALRQARGWSQAELFKRVDGLSFDYLRAIEMANRDADKARYPSPDALRRVAAALGEDPSVFPEYRLALARQALDEREVSLEVAIANLRVVERALIRPPALRAPEATRGGSTAKRSRAAAGAPRTARGG